MYQQVRKIIKFNRQFQPNFSKIDQKVSMSTKFKAIFRICCAGNGAKKAETVIFSSGNFFHLCIFFRLAIFPILIFPFMHFSFYPFKSFRISVLCSLSAFVRCIPLCEYPQTRLASGQLRAGSVTLGSELRLGSRLGTRAWLITDGFGAH